MQSAPLPRWDSEPDFSKFEDASEQERLDGYVDHVIARRKAENKEQKLLRLKKIGMAAGCIALVLAIVYAVNFIPTRIDRTVTCTQYNGATGEFYGTVEVVIQGRFFTPLFMRPYFTGDISLTQQGEFTEEQTFLPLGEKNGCGLLSDKVTFVEASDSSPWCGYLHYHDFATVGSSIITFGYMQLYEKDFSDFEIWVFEPVNELLYEEGGRSAGPDKTILDTDTVNRYYAQEK